MTRKERTIARTKRRKRVKGKINEEAQFGRCVAENGAERRSVIQFQI